MCRMNKLLTQQASTFTKYFSTINWDQFVAGFFNKFFVLIFIIVIFVLILWIGRIIINRAFKQYTKSNFAITTNRTNTIHALTLNIFRYTCFFFLLYALLSTIGVPVGTLIAGAGIFSIALGLGAQGFVNDVVTGFFILLEQQLDVGDIVELGNVKGTVTSLGIRTTQVTSADGTLNFIPNRNITVVSNFSRNNMIATVDLYIGSNAPLEKIESQIEAVNARLAPETPALSSAPKIIGPTLNKNNNLVYRVTMITENGKQDTIRSQFLAEYLTAIRAAKIDLGAQPKAPLI